MTTVYKNMKSLSFDNGATVYRLQDATARTSIGDLSDLTTPVKTDVVSAINSIQGNAFYNAKCPAITPVSGIATWVVTHNLGTTDIISTLYSSGGAEIVKNTVVNSANQITVTFNATSNISAEDYTIVILANGGNSSGSSYTLPTASTNTLGGVKIDGSSVTIDANGVISSHSGISTYITSTYRSGYTWCRIYSDGFCEQGGMYSGVNTTAKKILYHQAMNAVYVNLVGRTGETGTFTLPNIHNYYQVNFTDYTDGFMVAGNYGDGCWEAKGFVVS